MNALFTRLVRFLHWHRRPLAMALAALAVLATVAAAQEKQGATQSVLIAVHPVQPGATIAAADVARRALPRSAVPQNALTLPEDAVGKVATAGASPGTVLTTFSVVAPKLTLGSGLVLAPIRLQDADIAGYLGPGDRIDVVSATEAAAVTVARDAKVVAIPQPKGSGFGGDTRGVVVILAVTAAEATALAQAATAGRLSVALR